MINFRITAPDGTPIGVLNLTEEVANEVNRDPSNFTITPLWVKRPEFDDLVGWQLTIVPDVPSVSIPEFAGPYTLMLMSGEVVNEDLIGAVFDRSKHPIYLHTVDGKVYNYNNIIYAQRRPRA